MTLPHHSKRVLSTTAAVAAGLLLLGACGPADDDAVDAGDTEETDDDDEAGAETDDAEAEDDPATSWEGEWPDGYDFELDDPRLAIGEVIEPEVEGQLDYGKLTLADEPSDLTDASLVDPDVLGGLDQDVDIELITAALSEASRFVVEEAFDSSVLVDGGQERNLEWYEDHREDLFLDGDADGVMREFLESDEQGRYVMWLLIYEGGDVPAAVTDFPLMAPQYEQGGPRAAEYGFELTGVDVASDRAHLSFTYEAAPTFLMLQTTEAGGEFAEDPEFEGLGVGRLHALSYDMEYEVRMSLNEGGDPTGPDGWGLRNALGVGMLDGGELSEWELDVGGSDG